MPNHQRDRRPLFFRKRQEMRRKLSIPAPSINASRTSNARPPRSTGLPSANSWLWRRRTSKRPKRSVSRCSMGPPEITDSELESACLAARATLSCAASLRWNSEHFRSVKGLLKAAPGKIPQEAELKPSLGDASGSMTDQLLGCTGSAFDGSPLIPRSLSAILRR